MNNIIKRKWNQNSMVIIEDLQGMAFQAESGGHTFQISGIDGEGNTVALSGTPAGVMLRSDGQDVTLTCSVSGGVVFATLPANAYVVPGRFGLTIFLTSDGQKTAIYAAVGTVGKTSSGTVAPPAGSDVVTLVNQINTAIAAIPANYNACFAPAYSTSGLYSVGQYVTYNGNLYRCNTAITTAETWTAAHWTQTNLGADVYDLKSAIDDGKTSLYVCNEKVIGGTPLIFESGAYRFTDSYTKVDVNTIEANSDMMCSKIKCSEGKKFRVHLTGANAYRAYGFIDSSGNVLSPAAGSNATVDTTIIAPANTAYAVFNAKVAYPGYYVYMGRSVVTDLDALSASTDAKVEKVMDELSQITYNINDEIYEKGDIDADTGENASGNNTRSVGYIPVSASTEYYYKVTGSNGRIFFYGSDYAFIERTAGWITEGTLTTPATAYYCRVLISGYDNGAKMLLCLTSQDKRNYVPHISSVDYIARDEMNETIKTEDTRNIFGGVLEHGAINTSGNNTSSDTAYRTEGYLPIEASTMYYFRIFDDTGRIFFYKSDKSFADVYSNGWRSLYAFKTPANAAYFRMQIGGSAQLGKTIVSKLDTNANFPNTIDKISIIDAIARDEIQSLKNCYHQNAVTVSSFNVGKWYDGVTRVPEEQVQSRRSAWLRFMGKANADLIGMNEAVEYFDVNETIKPFESFMHTSFTDFNKATGSDDHDNAIASKIPLYWVGYVGLELNTGALNGFIYVNGKPVEFLCVHLSTEEGSDGRRVRDMGRLAAWLSERDYAFVCGDFNAYALSEYTTNFSAYNMANCGDFGQIETCPEASGFKCLDNIITTKNIEISYAYAYTDETISDHVPIIARLLVK